MNYPKQVMTKSELMALGFRESYLLSLSRLPNQSFCWKASAKVNSPLLFDTDELNKFITKQVEIQRRSIKC